MTKNEYGISIGPHPGIVLPESLAESVRGDIDRWCREVLEPKLAAIATQPEFVAVTTLERRRAEAEASITKLTARIEEIKATCASIVLNETTSLAEEADEIADCESKIATARLIIDSVDQSLPSAIQVRQRAVKPAIREALQGVERKLQEEMQRTEGAIVAGLEKPAKALVSAFQRLQRVQQLTQPQFEAGLTRVLDCANRENQTTK